METPLELKVQTTNASACGRILSIEFPRRHFEAERERVLRELRKRVVRPGFRKGKVPLALLERDFAERVRADALEKLIPEVTNRAIAQEGLDVISVPNVRTLDLEHPEMVRMDVELEVRPRLPALALEALRVEAWKPEVREADLEQALASVQEEQAQYVSVQREARDGDFVVLSYVPLDAAGKEVVAQRVENYPFQLGEGEVVAEFEAATRGLTPGQSAKAEVQYAADHENKEVAGKLVAFLLTLQDVKEKHLPALDDELGRDLGLENLEALRQKVQADLERRMAEASERDLREKLVDGLLTAHPFEVPPSMVQRFLDLVVEDYEERHRRMRLEVAPDKREALRQSAQPSAERAARRALLVEHLATLHELQATAEEVDKWIEEKVPDGPEAPRLRRYFADAERRRRLRHDLTEDKVFAFVKSKAQVVEVPRP
ncbi:MAG TPA: trigger factor [Candidatus Krumholzibacteria bacterium]|nr:trigger factor [Candidatus Krumholzibacteria bacterium]